MKGYCRHRGIKGVWGMRSLLLPMSLVVCMGLVGVGCQETKEHTAPAIHERDSVPIMTTYGVNTLISDSGIIKYRIVAERWEINENRNPSRWTFEKGILFTQFDEKKRILGYISCDTAVYFDKERRWMLRGRVRIRTAQGMEYSSEQLNWDERNHKLSSNVFSHVKTPDRELQGDYFRSDETMTSFEIGDAKGWGLFRKDEMSPSDAGGVPPGVLYNKGEASASGDTLAGGAPGRCDNH